MILRLLEAFHLNDPERIKNLFYTGQILVAALLVGGIFYFRGRAQDSGFRVREAERLRPGKKSVGPDALADARLKPGGGRADAGGRPFRLEGIRIEGASAHEILGVAPGAGAAEIQRAYRELMKRYHPDKVGPPGSREWKDAQKIAEAINLAKEELLKSGKGRPR